MILTHSPLLYRQSVLRCLECYNLILLSTMKYAHSLTRLDISSSQVTDLRPIIFPWKGRKKNLQCTFAGSMLKLISMN